MRCETNTRVDFSPNPEHARPDVPTPPHRPLGAAWWTVVRRVARRRAERHHPVRTGDRGDRRRPGRPRRRTWLDGVVAARQRMAGHLAVPGLLAARSGGRTDPP